MENGSLVKLREYKELGASFLVIDKTRNPEIPKEFPLIYSDVNFDIYRLESVSEDQAK